jgi:hypothetical protein
MAMNLKDTPFSIDRLFVWAIGITLLFGMLGMVVIGYQGRAIPPQIQSAVMFCLGVFAARIEKQVK